MPDPGHYNSQGIYLVPALNGTFINPDDCTVQICPLSYANLRYVPTFAGNLAYLIIFAILLAAQLFLGIRYRTWGFLVGMLCGLLLEIIGYAGRVLLHDDVFNFNWFVIYLVCLTIGPAFLCASIYLCLSRLVVVYGRNIARFSPAVYAVTFMVCDFVSLVLQGTGGGLAATANTNAGSDAGVNVMIAGLAWQVVSLVLFGAVSVDFIIAVRRAGRQETNPHFTSLRSAKTFRLLPWALALATLTITIRCIFRVAELQGGFDSKLANDEVLFMIFEGPMIMIAVISLTILHPGIAFQGAWSAANWSFKKGGPGSPGGEGKERDIEAEDKVIRGYRA